MEVPEVVSKLRDFGNAEAVSMKNGNVIFHLECELESQEELEEITEYLDNMYPEELVVTGKNKKSLFIIKIDSSEFSTIPPYLYDNWTETDEDNRYA